MDFDKFYRFTLIFQVFLGFQRFPMDFKRFRGQSAWWPVASCAALWRPAAADRIPLILRFQILEAWIWRPGAWMSAWWQDRNGLGEVTEVTALWGEGIGRNSHTLKLLGGLDTCCKMKSVTSNMVATQHILISRMLKTDCEITLQTSHTGEALPKD